MQGDYDQTRKFYVDKRLYWKPPNSNQPTTPKSPKIVTEEDLMSKEGLVVGDDTSQNQLEAKNPNDLILDDQQHEFIRSKFPPEVIKMLDNVGHKITQPDDKYQKWLSSQLDHILGVKKNVGEGFTPIATPCK